jgi:hypothetical protein
LALSPLLAPAAETIAAIFLTIPRGWQRPGDVRIVHLGFHFGELTTLDADSTGRRDPTAEKPARGFLRMQACKL